MYTSSRVALEDVGVKQRRAYNAHSRGRGFGARKSVWVYSLVRKKGAFAKANAAVGGAVHRA